MPAKATDIAAVINNTQMAVTAFIDQWIPLPRFCPPCEVMDQGQLRDAMGLIPTIDIGDPWPDAEMSLLNAGFRWHQMGGQRVMFLREREGFEPDTGWEEAVIIHTKQDAI